MDTIIRCHVGSPERLKLLRDAVVSWHDKQLNTLGTLYLVDDTSPMRAEVRQLADEFKLTMHDAGGVSDTKNGLYASLKFHRDILGKDEPVLCCVDDLVFGRGFVERLQRLQRELPMIPRYAVIGFFACYTYRPMVPATDLWQIPTEALYALVCHVVSPQLRDIIIERWEAIQAKTATYPGCCDDIWVKWLAQEFDLPCYNSLRDYAQHTGVQTTTFEGRVITQSQYVSQVFVGE